MSDHDLRSLERTFRASRDPAAEARWLSAALAAGRLEPADLELSAALGHEPARVALGGAAPEQAGRGWAVLLSERGWPLAGRAQLGVLRWATDRLTRAVHQSPGDEARGAWARLADELVHACEELLRRGPDPRGAAIPMSVRAQLGYARGLEPEDHPELGDPTRAVINLGARLGDPHAFHWLPLESLEAPLPAVRGEVVPWLLHGDDPILAREQADLDEVRVASPCDASWEAMQGDERARFCLQCRLHVFDLSAMTSAEALTLVKGNTDRLCVRFAKRDDGRMLTQDCSWGLSRRLEPLRAPPVMMGMVFSTPPSTTAPPPDPPPADPAFRPEGRPGLFGRLRSWLGGD
jgi:hypothetical protein